MPSYLESRATIRRPAVDPLSDKTLVRAPLLEAFARLKTRPVNEDASSEHRRRPRMLRLVLAGPDPAAVSEDPEGQEALGELRRM